MNTRIKTHALTYHCELVKFTFTEKTVTVNTLFMFTFKLRFKFYITRTY